MDEMKASWTSRPTEQVLAAIQALDVEPVKVRMMDPVRGEGWTREHADAVEITYKNFLSMLVKHPEHAEEIAMSEDTDEFWHTHILQTRKYAEDCQEMFGTYLHHSPHLEEITPEYEASRAASAEKTHQLYAQEFGAAMNEAWNGNIEAPEAAYSGASIKASKAAYSGATVKAPTAAYSGASIKTSKAAYSGASIKASNAAYSGASIKASKAAYSGASIKTSKVAYSGASIKASNAAYSGASIRASKAAYSGASIKASKAAYSGASIKASNAAYSGASINASKAAYSGASIKPSKAAKTVESNVPMLLAA
jgi:hypothetical protein